MYLNFLRLSILSFLISLTAGSDASAQEQKSRANTDPVYQKLRQQGQAASDLPNLVARVNNLVIKRDAAQFSFITGEIYLFPAIEGRTVNAVFIGDGKLNLTPPTQEERKNLSIFTGEPSIEEQFSSLVLRFTDRTLEEIKQSQNVNITEQGSNAARARDMLRENQMLQRRGMHSNIELRMLQDLYSRPRRGFFLSFINGKRFKKLAYMLDPLSNEAIYPEEAMLVSYGDTDGGIWTAFHLQDEYQKGVANSSQEQRLIDITNHLLNVDVNGTKIDATDEVTFRVIKGGSRVVPFSLFGPLRVSKVVDEKGRELDFIQEGKEEDPDFAVIYPEILESGTTQKLTVHYGGNGALVNSGGGNYYLISRSSWYPNNSHMSFERATFDVTYTYPKGHVLVGTGSMASPEVKEGDNLKARWVSGPEIAVAGFNIGRFIKREVEDRSGYKIEFYANKELPDEMKGLQRELEVAEARGEIIGTTLGSASTTKMADSALADAQNSARIYTTFFGKLPFSRFAMTQQPAQNFGQAWPTLIYMPYFAFMDTTHRVELMGGSGGTDTFWRYVGPHEIAHQWWGHTIGSKSYRDYWMIEGFSEFSASLYVQYVRRNIQKFTEFWEEQRKLIVDATPATKGRRPYTVGPLSLGHRLSNGKTGAVSRAMIYPKGAYVLHMIRMMMMEREGDKLFQQMMQDFVTTHYNKDVSNEDFQRAVEKHITPAMDIDGNRKLDWFFNQWVYGTEVPSYTFEYQLRSNGAGTVLSGKITQSGVSDNFKMLVPLYADFGKGWVKLGNATLIGNNTLDIKEMNLPQPAKKAAICALNDVLAVQIVNQGR
jgi:hypothetical protein